jgi:hypothetical protein
MSNLPPGVKGIQLLDENGKEVERFIKPIGGFRFNIKFIAKDVPHIEDGTRLGRIIVAADENSAMLMFKAINPECEIIQIKLAGAAVRSPTDIENFRG